MLIDTAGLSLTEGKTENETNIMDQYCKGERKEEQTIEWMKKAH